MSTALRSRIVISDTNILSSLAVGGVFPLLFQLFSRSQFCVPPAVFDELQAGQARGKAYLTPVLQAIAAHQIILLPLSASEEQLLSAYPNRLNLGECQAIALTETRQALLLSNDKRAIRYCQSRKIRVVNLENILRQLWLRNIMTRNEVKGLIDRMALIERLVISPERQAVIFAR